MGRPRIADTGGVSGSLARWLANPRQMLANVEWQEIIVHPLIFAVFPVLTLYVENVGEGFLREAVAVGIGALAVTAVLWLLATLLIRDGRKSAVIVSVFVILFFSYGHAMSAFGALLERLPFLGGTEHWVEGRFALRLWLIIWAVLFVVATGVIVRLKSDLRTATQFLNVVALALLLMVGVNVAVGGGDFLAGLSAGAEAASTGNATESEPSAAEPTTTGGGEAGADRVAEYVRSWEPDLSVGHVDAATQSLPDVYYIVVDAYARADILRDVYGFDNSDFLSYLSRQGFYVADESVSNYPQTALSLASSLNLIYLDSVASEMGTETDNRQPLQVMIKKNRVFRYFEKLGYTILACKTGYGFTELTEADVYMAPPKQWSLSEFQEALVTLTPLSVFRKTWFDFRRDRVTYAFDHVADAARRDEPTLTFVHVLVPHWPFIFDADGQPIQPPKGIGMRTDYDYDQFIEGYQEQLAFVNSRLKSAIDEILSHSSSEPIIVIQADHGPDAKLDFGWNIEKTYLPERLSILNAYYFPGQDYGELYPSITPVNTFRVVLSEFLGAEYDLLEDRSYFATWERPYVFTDVTEEVTPPLEP